MRIFLTIRTTLLSTMVLAMAAPVLAQYNPATPIVPVQPPPPTPSYATPGMNLLPPPVTRDSHTDPLTPVPLIRQGTPSRETHNDRSIRCVHQGAALGVPPGAIGQYTQECVNAQ